MKQYDPNHEYPENLTTAMHGELLEDEYSQFEMSIMGVYGRMKRGYSKQEALEHYGLTEEQYDSNVDAVMAKP